MFAVLFFLLLLCWAAFGLAQLRWIERMLHRVNADLPPHEQFSLFGGPAHSLRAHAEFRKVDPLGYRKAMLGFLAWGLSLLAATLWLMKRIGQ